MDRTLILRELSGDKLLNYQLLSQKSYLDIYPELLSSLLKEAEKNFEKILEMKESEVTFSNLIEASFEMDRPFMILYGFIHSLNATNSTDQTRKIIEDFQPRVVDYFNKVSLNQRYYALHKALSKQKKLSPTQKRSIELFLRDMKQSGVHLPEIKRKELEKINKEMSKLSEKFENNILDSRKAFFYEFKDKKTLEGVPENSLEAARLEAKNRKSKAAYVFTLSPPSIQAIMKYCSDRNVRELFYKKNLTLASSGKLDNRSLVIGLLKLRARKAQLLGHKNFVDYVLQERMAGSAKEIQNLLTKIFSQALQKSKAELRELSVFSGIKKMEEWDMAFYSDKLSTEKFGVNEKELKEFFPLQEVIQGLFTIASKLFGITLKEIPVKAYDPTVKVFEIYKNNSLIAYYLADFFARPSKKAGAWCNDLRGGNLSTDGKFLLPIIINVMNFSQGNKKAKALLTHRDVETLFHEFGHALHLMLSSKTYANLNGFHTEWDFVEFPSQLFENWCWEKEALDIFARHYKTGKKLSAALVTKLQKSKTFMSGYKILRQLEFAFLDLTLHQQKPPKTVKELDALCDRIIKKYAVLKKFHGYRMYTSFDHVFTGGYSAGYYSYLWAEILEADCFLKIKKNGILKSDVGSTYATKILAQGSQKSGKELFRDFMGRNPDVGAFMKKHHFQ